MSSGGSSVYSPWLYKAAALGLAATLTAGAGYVIYKYVLSPEPESDSDKPALSMQSLLTGGAAGATGSSARRGGIPVRKTPASPKSRAGPSLPARKTSSSTPKSTAAPSAAAPDATTPDAAATGSESTDAAASSADAAGSTASSAAAPVKPVNASLKACACCSSPLKTGGLPQRCGQCKAAYYCSAACQKKHWPEHKGQCAKPGGKAGATAGAAAAVEEGTAAAVPAAEAEAEAVKLAEAAAEAPESPPAEAAAEAPESPPAEAAPETASEPAADAAGTSSATEAPAATGGEAAATAGDSSGNSAASRSSTGGASGGTGASHGGGLQGALVEVLRQAAEKGAGTLDGAFEEAVMHFLGGQLQTALKAFESLQASAREKKREDLVLELHKWLGHTNTKLGNFSAAADAFQAGIDAAKAAGNTMAQVDNAVGLGNLWKLAGKLTQAAEVLKTALVVAQEADSAGMQSEVLVALGNVVMAVDPEEGLACLQIAVKLREDEVAKAAETGDRAAMATGMMQAAAAMVNMGAALFATRRFNQSKQVYEQAMEIFELMEDHDKVIQVLINLANLAELQLDQPAEALEYRQKLAALLKEAGHSGLAGGAPSPPCGICKKPIALYKVRPRGDAGAAMVLLGCLHVQHDACFKDWSDRAQLPAEALAAAGAGAGGEEAAALAATAASPGAKRTTVCPTCSAPVPVMT